MHKRHVVAGHVGGYLTAAIAAAMFLAAGTVSHGPSLGRLTSRCFPLSASRGRPGATVEGAVPGGMVRASVNAPAAAGRSRPASSRPSTASSSDQESARRHRHAAALLGEADGRTTGFGQRCR